MKNPFSNTKSSLNFFQAKTVGRLVETKASLLPHIVATTMVLVGGLIFGGNNSTGCS